MTSETDRSTETRANPTFRRHRFLSYQGYAFPWYATLIWISFFIGGLIYLVRNLLFR